MNIIPSNEQVSKSKKALTAFVVVGVLLVSALVINSIQQKTNLGAQAGFFAKILDSIFGGPLDPLKRIPNSSSTFATDGFENGNAFIQTENGELILNLDNPDGVQGLAIHPDQNGVAYLPSEEDPDGLSSYIVTFKADPIAVKTKDILKSQGKEILPGEKNRDQLKRDIQNIKPQIDSQKATINTQQNTLLTKLSNKYGSATPLGAGDIKVYKPGTDEEVRVRQLKTTLNAVTISNVTEDEIEELTRGISSIDRVEKARPVTASLVETPTIINTVQLQEYLGANGAPLTGEGTTIAIVDTGVDYMHQDLGACNFLVEGGCKVAGGYDFINDDPDPMDDHGHGTHVAATAAGNGFWTEANGNTQPLLGIAPDATIYAYKVLSGSGSGSNITVIQGIEACADPNGDGDFSDRVTVCSLSLGSPSGDPLDSDALAADAAVDAGVIMTIAAGNDGPGLETIGSPGTSRKAITVGAACKPEDIGNDQNCSEAVASFSSRGPIYFTDENGQEQVLNKPDIVSPGVNICAAQWGDWLDQRSCLGDGEHIAINGTSMATPTVAGLMALLAQAHPDKSVAELKETLMATATDLGLPVEIQGQGLVDGMTALEGLGIPNSILAIEGLPFYVDDLTSTQNASYEQELSLENISDSVLNLTATRITDNQGVTMTFPQSFSINPGQNFDFNIVMNIDHSEAVSGQNVKETIALSNGEETVNIVISRRTPNYLIPDTDLLNFGLFHESEDTFSQTLTLNLDNRLTDFATAYDVVVEPYSIQGQYQDNISVTTSVDSILLGPGGSTSIDITINASATNGNPLPNNFYRTNLKLISDTEVIPIELEFFRGYAFDLYYGSEVPNYFVVSGDKWQKLFYPNPQMDTLRLRATKAGPFNVVALYLDEDGDFDRATVISELDIELDPDAGIPVYDLSKVRAEHRIENHYFGNSCSFRFSPEDGDASRSFGMFGGGRWAFEYNTFPQDFRFSSICGHHLPEENRILFSQMYLTEGINQDFSLNDETADISTRFIYGFNNKEASDELSLGVNICNFRYFKHPGEINSFYNMCSFWHNSSGDYLTIPEGEAAIIEVRSLHTDTPETTSVPDFPAFRIHALNKQDGSPLDKVYMYTSAEMFATSEKLYAWTAPTSGILSTPESTVNAYQKNKVEVVNDAFITLGTGPLVDTTMVRAYKDIFGFLAGNVSSRPSLYRFADGTTESRTTGNPDPGKARFTFTRNGELFHTKIANLDNMPYFGIAGAYLPDENGIDDPENPNYAGPATGEYVVTTERLAKFDGQMQDGEFSSELTFEISNQTIDSVPPVIENVQLVANNLLQNHFDPATPSVLHVFANPGYGIQNHNLELDDNEAFQIDFIEDQIAEISVLAGDSFGTLTALPTPQLVDGKYVVDLSSLSASGTHKYFQVFLRDATGNTMRYNFPIEVGTALEPMEVGDPILLEVCERQAPTITPVGYVESQPNGPGSTQSFQIAVTNNDSAVCDPVSIMVQAFEYLPNFALGKTNWVSSANSTFGSVSLTLNPGETKTRNIFYRNFGGAVDMNVPISVQLSSGATPIHSVAVEPYITYGTPADGEDPVVCTPGNPTLSWMPNPITIDSGDQYTTGTFTVTNNDSAPCAPSNFSLAFDTDQYASFENGTQEIRGTGGSPAGNGFNTTEFTISTGNLNPGQSFAMPAHFRTDQYFPNGQYQIGLTLTDTTNNEVQNVPFTVTVTGAEFPPVCTPENPTLTFTPNPVSVDSGGPYTSVDFTVTNNDSAPCAPSNFSLAFDTDQYASFENGTQEIRGTGGSPANNDFITTEFSIATGLLASGQSYTGTANFRTDQYFPNGQYQVGLTLTDTTNNQTQTIPFEVSVYGAEEPIVCVPSNATVSFSPIPVTIDSGGPYVPVSFTITNQDTEDCDPSAFSLAIDTDQYASFENGTREIKGSLNAVNNFTTTEFTLSSGMLDGGESYTGTGYLRTDLYFPNGQYQIGAVLTDTTNNQTQTIPFYVTVTGAEVPPPPPNGCVRNPATLTPVGLITSWPNGTTSTKAYQLAITNNDSAGCPTTTFRVLITESTNSFGLNKANLVLETHNKFDHTWSLAPGQTQTKNVFYKNFGGVVDQSVPLTITVTDITYNNSTHTPQNLSGSIVYGNPPATLACSADFNGDGTVTAIDQLLFNTGYGSNNETYDLDNDGDVDGADLLVFLGFMGTTGCPVENPVLINNNNQNGAGNQLPFASDPAIVVTPSVTSFVSGGSTVYEYEIFIQNTSAQLKNNISVFNIIPVAQLPYSQFVAATVPNIEVNLATGTLFIPSMNPGQKITVFVTATVPN